MRYRQLLEACWKGYHKEGMKTMFGKKYPNCVKNKKSNEDVDEDNSRIARKPGQPANSKKHSDLYTDENPKGTITGLKFATAEDARASVSKIRNSGRSHAHKIQAAVAMEQRAEAAGKTKAASVYRKYINATKKTEGVAEGEITSNRVRRIQNFLNDKFNANLDVDGVLGPLTLKTIDKFMPDAKKRLAPEPDNNTNVQGLEKKLSEQELEEDLRKWFKEKWVRFGPDGKIKGPCARGSESEGKPKCLPQSKAHSLGKKKRASAAARKRREDPNPERSGKAINVATKSKRDNK